MKTKPAISVIAPDVSRAVLVNSAHRALSMAGLEYQIEELDNRLELAESWREVVHIVHEYVEIV